MTIDATTSEDWIKTLAWDLPSDVAGLIWAIGASSKDTQGQADALRNLMTLPAWTAAPPTLRSQVEALVNTTPAKRSSVLGSRVRRWSDQRDWATWDLEHPYVPVGSKVGATTSTPAMDDIHATAMAMALAGGQPISLASSALPALMDACKVSSDPINLMNVHVDGSDNLFDKSSLNLPRIQMPVISDTADAQNFASTLSGKGINASWESVDPTTLTATQNELDGVKVGSMLQAMRDNNGIIPPPPTPTLVTDQNGSILDGHHRWAAAAAYAVENPGFKVPIVRMSTDIATLVPLGHEYDASIPGHEKAKAFGQTSAKLLAEWRAVKAGTNWATPPADAPPVPDITKPYFWLDGKGWLLMATDTQDGIPRDLSYLPKQVKQ